MYKKILVPLDGSSLAECVLPHVEGLAAASNAEVVLATVAAPQTEGSTDPQHRVYIEQALSRLEDEVMGYLNKVQRQMQGKGIKASPVMLLGRPAEQITDYAS